MGVLTAWAVALLLAALAELAGEIGKGNDEGEAGHGAGDCDHNG